MIDIFINSERIDENYNGARPMSGEYQKTVIIVSGSGGVGKSTVCKDAFNIEVEYIAVDMAMINIASEIKEMRDFVKKYGKDSIFNIHLLSEIVNKSCKDKFVEVFFDKYIKKNMSKKILLDGFVFTYEAVLIGIANLCKRDNIRLWRMVRL